jgi:hypothetical protein
MKLNHLNLVVTDVAAASHLFETYFGFNCIERKGDNAIVVLKGKDNFTLVLMTGKIGETIYPQAFHIGFMQDSEKAVIEISEKLKSGNFVADQEPKKIRDSFGFYFTFGNLMIEVGYYFS